MAVTYAKGLVGGSISYGRVPRCCMDEPGVPLDTCQWLRGIDVQRRVMTDGQDD